MTKEVSKTGAVGPVSTISIFKKSLAVCLFLTLAISIVFYNMPLLNKKTKYLRHLDKLNTKRIIAELAEYKHITPDRLANQMATSGKFNIKAPLPFLKDWKNFCWDHTYPSGRKKFLCLPNFYIVGFRKCGTTDLFYRLGLHPEVSIPWRKETLWWTYHRFWVISIYADLFGAKTFVKGEEQRNFFVMGDADPSIAVQNKMIRDMVLSVGDIIKYYTPNAKFIFIMRNPVDRLYSDYLYSQLGVRSPRDFHRRVKSTIEVYTDCFKQRSIRKCLYDSEMKNIGHHNRLALHQGMYVIYVFDWLQIFGAKQVICIRSEDFARKSSKTYKKILEFLELEALGDEQIASIAAMSAMNRNAATRKASGPMENSTREILRDFYRPFNHALAKVLKHRKWVWDDDRILWDDE
ncbi:carbohydrate sulfotransferase 15-like [Lineus longissimus]|uniref:carbohydrate sulfotransferase 15-like n=1 Tax=Lineus longissimus TaxID=88925 RepID=UPI00315D6D55